MPFTPGLVSISFRQLDPAGIADLANRAGLKAIEWGADVHVPSGDLARAREVAAITADAGLRTACYGSYYRLSVSEQNGMPFSQVLETAAALEAPSIRVWAGNTPSATITEEARQAVVEDALRCADLAASAGIKLTVEYHGGTLTDCDASAVRFLNEAPHPNLFTLWQPINGETRANNLTALEHVLPRLLNLHVFHWSKPADPIIRHPLAEGRENWSAYLELANTPDVERFCLMEFVLGDDPEQLLTDAATLREWLKGY
ncbi:sugar phosphate isomerase/epimerase [Ruficoccus sp. ZRK36]|uniref:sugar phosphate isomerase/epimerase family protein n=1 Tax=Ruficoccus sp. ZRK36 TaxID=2866311 RepID=UPI001C73316D|nr:sugar phosphate isomerase/epimerase [Ruficoccus sp. ZRK36]QYY35894.1 sugar phosphate isomerase/epimerase [Ruficoccus sp. ZRK36]